MQNEMMRINSNCDCIQEFLGTPHPGIQAPQGQGICLLFSAAPHSRAGNRSWHKADAHYLLTEGTKGPGSVIFSHSLTMSPPLSICPVGVC